MLSDATAVKASVEGYIARHSLLDRQSKYLVALSGGADSVALLLLLLDLGYAVEAVHCNFHLRGAESDRDEAFVERLCNAKGVVLHLAHFDTLAYASLHKVSIEMAARNLRYAHFEQLRRDIGAAAVCVAHHRNDNVETVLMNLVRGTGIHGLVGIRPVNGTIVRPLLCVSREDIECYLRSIGQDYVTDSTNLVADVTRNKIRLNVIPMLEKINPKVVESIQRTADYVAEAAKVYDVAIEEAVGEVLEKDGDRSVIDVNRLQQLPSPEGVLFRILGDYGFSPQQVEQINASIHAEPGRIVSSPAYDLLFDRGRLLIAERGERPKILRIPEPGAYVYSGERRLRVSLVPVGSDFCVSRQSDVVSVDAARVAFPLTLRPLRPGDRFVPFGMKGSKLVSDYLTDRKMDLFAKRSQLVLEDAHDNIVWVVCERVDNRCRITEKTSEALVLSFG